MDKLVEIVKLQMSLQKRVANDPRIPPWKPRAVEYKVITEGLGVGQTGMIQVPEGKHYLMIPGQERMKAWMNHVIAEARETKEALGFTENDQLKHWKDKIDWEAVFEELEDILHFVLAPMMEIVEHVDVIGTGISTVKEEHKAEYIAKVIFERYVKKLEENHARQDRGY